MIDVSTLNDYEQILLGVYILAHGFIHWIFLFNFKDEKTGMSTGFNGSSWILEKFITKQQSRLFGQFLFLGIAVSFMTCGILILDLFTVQGLLEPLLILTSLMAILSYLIFFSGLTPTPYHWILGLVIDITLFLYVTIFYDYTIMILALLVLIFVYGMVFHMRLLKALGYHESVSS